MDNETRVRIEKEADDYAFQLPYDGTENFYDKAKCEGYIAGATAEHSRITELLKEERNKTIDEVIKKLDNEYVERGDINAPWKNIKYDIESLKGKQQ